jgi:hypothetical protein
VDGIWPGIRRLPRTEDTEDTEMFTVLGADLLRHKQ